MANPLTDADLTKFMNASIKSGDQCGFGRGGAPLNSGVSYSEPDSIATVKNTGHSLKSGYATILIYPTTDATHKIGFSYSHVDSGTGTGYTPTSPWSAHGGNEFGSGTLNHVYNHITVPSSYTTAQKDQIKQNLKDVEADSNATLVEIWATQKPNKDTRPFWFEQFGSSTIAYQSKRKRKRARQSFT